MQGRESFRPNSHTAGTTWGGRFLPTNAPSLPQFPTTMAMAVAAYTSRRFATNAVHITIVPSPTGLVESREIMRVLQGFGELITYKSLKVTCLSLSIAFIDYICSIII